MKLQQVLSRVRQAVDDYHMVEENDYIAVGISGGKVLRFYTPYMNCRNFIPCLLSFRQSL